MAKQQGPLGKSIKGYFLTISEKLGSSNATVKNQNGVVLHVLSNIADKIEVLETQQPANRDSIEKRVSVACSDIL
jgi:hypothetical protein